MEIASRPTLYTALYGILYTAHRIALTQKIRKYITYTDLNAQTSSPGDHTAINTGQDHFDRIDQSRSAQKSATLRLIHQDCGFFEGTSTFIM